MSNPHRQGWRGSMAEAIFNVALGFVISLLVWHWGVRPAIHAGWLSVDHSIVITIIFTFVSLARTFIVRRLATWLADRRSGKVFHADRRDKQ